MNINDDRLPRDTEVTVKPGNRHGRIATPIRDSGSYHVRFDDGHTAWIAARNVESIDNGKRKR